ncbi:hypothetical protein MNB_SUP05-10-923 [hydrothermal vent metagenome]|uniref:Uncharacterized protein n=1 Tax=hydrothermal vent metagenome TaxID=652676 RepID=A0A1W1D8E5_9ZZZZ
MAGSVFADIVDESKSSDKANNRNIFTASKDNLVFCAFG